MYCAKPSRHCIFRITVFSFLYLLNECYLVMIKIKNESHYTIQIELADKENILGYKTQYSTLRKNEEIT